MSEKQKMLKCWELLNCDKENCPAYKSQDLACWLIDATQCYNEIQGSWLEKVERCVTCKVFESNLDKENINKSLLVITEQFKEYKNKIKEHQKDLIESQKKLTKFKTTSIYLLKELDKKNIDLQNERINLEKRVEEKTREMKGIHAKLLQSTKMAAIGQFSAGIAHEINNPLGAIINHANTLIAKSEINGQDRDYLDLIMQGLKRIENIVQQILGFSGKQRSDLKLVTVAQTLNESLAFVQHKLNGKKIEFSRNLVNPSLQILVDPAQIQQVFINIISNAVDALEKNGKLNIEIVSDKKNVEVRFSDNGRGIKENDLEKIFDPFFTTKEVGSGTGLGLFISYNIIKLYQGTIDIQSEVGKGTQVSVKLPLSEVS